MKRQGLLPLTALLLTMCCTGFAEKTPLPDPKPSLQPINQIVAVVNKTIIDQSELDRAIQATKQQFQMRGIPLPKQAVMQEKTLNSLIDEKLQLEVARQNHIDATDEQVAKAIKSIAKRNHFTLEQLKEQLAPEGITYDEFQEQIRDQITVSHLQQQALAGKIDITPEEISTFQKKLEQKNQTTRYNVIDYLLSDKEKANTFVKAMRDNPKTANTDGVESNPLGWRNLDDIPDVFATRVVAMKNNSIAGPIATGNGYHVIRLVDTKKETDPVSEQQAREILYQEKFQEQLHAWLKTLRDSAYIKNYLVS